MPDFQNPLSSKQGVAGSIPAGITILKIKKEINQQNFPKIQKHS